MCFEAGLDHVVRTKPVEEMLSCCELLKQAGAGQPRLRRVGPSLAADHAGKLPFPSAGLSRLSS